MFNEVVSTVLGKKKKGSDKWISKDSWKAVNDRGPINNQINSEKSEIITCRKARMNMLYTIKK